jgi:molecular chaperone GrpE
MQGASDMKNDLGPQEEAQTPEGKASKRGEEATIEDLQERLEEQKMVAQNNYDKFLRAYAELENYKKRMSKERKDLLTYANEELIREILPFVDNLERAINHASSEGNDSVQALIEGIQLTIKNLMKVLEKHGLKQIESVGRRFDPNLHEAVMQVKSESHEPHTVTEEFEKGYIMKDRLLRPARVAIAMKPELTEDNKAGEDA